MEIFFVMTRQENTYTRGIYIWSGHKRLVDCCRLLELTASLVEVGVGEVNKHVLPHGPLYRPLVRGQHFVVLLRQQLVLHLLLLRPRQGGLQELDG